MIMHEQPNFRYRQNNCSDNQKAPVSEAYFNIESTSNRYILKYNKVDNIEDLGDNFKIISLDHAEYRSYCNHYDIENILSYGAHNQIFVADKQLIDETLNEYKQQLIEDKKKTIIDSDLSDSQLRYFLRESLLNIGLTFSKTNELILKRKTTVKPKIVKEAVKEELNRHNCHKTIRNSIFARRLQEYIQETLGFRVTLYINSTNLYSVLTSMKAMLHNVSFKQMSQRHYDAKCLDPYDSICEELWNKPELAKLPPTKGKK